MADVTVLGGDSLVTVTIGNDTISLGSGIDTGPGVINVGLNPHKISVGALGYGLTVSGSLSTHLPISLPTLPGSSSLASLAHGSGAVTDFASGSKGAAAAAPDTNVRTVSSYLTLADGNHVELKNFVPAGTEKIGH